VRETQTIKKTKVQIPKALDSNLAVLIWKRQIFHDADVDDKKLVIAHAAASRD
jgi:hypothetical protein